MVSSIPIEKSWFPDLPKEFHNSQDCDDFEDYDDCDRHCPSECCKMMHNLSFGSDCSWETWDSDMVKEKLKDIGLADIGVIFKEHEITGNMLTRISDSYLKKMGISKVGHVLQVRKFIDDVTMKLQGSLVANRKVFNDPIHGLIELHPLCVKIIDTPQFQRLRFLRQLGLCYFVYPGASHNRFEHCLGVCHLAGKLVRTLRRRQPELDITDVDVLCVEIAGLCHDLGHGPFSHLFDGKFIPLMCPDKPWKHEEASKKMFCYMLEENNLFSEFEKYGLGQQDIIFIVEQVAGPKNNTGWPYMGRAKKKSFLYEVVANKRNGIDVDKWDYFARDCHMLGIKNNFDHNRFIHFARVLEVDEQLQICSRDEEVGNLYDMFHTRNTLQRRAYQHKTNNIIEVMVTEALMKANNHIKFAGKDRPLTMTEAIYDMKAFSQMTDDVFFRILHSTNSELAESREILDNILVRKLYKCVGQTQLKHSQVLKDSDVPRVKEDIFKIMDPDELVCSPLKKDDIVVILVYLDYGMKDKNPIDSVRFYSKESPNIAIQVNKDQVSNLLPETFAEQQICVYCKVTDPRSLDLVKRAFIEWCKQNSYPQPKGGSVTAMELTPVKPQHNPTISEDCSTKGNNNVTPGSAGKFCSRLTF